VSIHNATGDDANGASARPDALRESLEVQAAASALGFDWPDVHGVLEKVEEELGEIRSAVAHGDLAQARRELGDLLLITVNLARFLDAAPEQELHAATERFSRRLDALKQHLAQSGIALEACSLDELNAVWDQVKRTEQAD
jgi:uncharacterized protein YabN with tetrapyrrole methylase and pyrophosphatase domain